MSQGVTARVMRDLRVTAGVSLDLYKCKYPLKSRTCNQMIVKSRVVLDRLCMMMYVAGCDRACDA